MACDDSSCIQVRRVAELGLTCAIASTQEVKKVPANILSRGQVAAYYAIGADWKPGKPYIALKRLEATI